MIKVENLDVQVGRFVLQNLSMQIPGGSYGVLMGRTGCGKTTLLEAIAGLRPIRSGTILLGDRNVTDLVPARRQVGFVPQESALFSFLSVRENLAFALSIRRQKQRVINHRVDELAELLHITHLLERRTKGLSGGERQRVALGRALAFQPPVLLMDEPLSAIDEETRQEMYTLLRLVQQESGVTTLHVTHNPDEARNLADIIFVMRDGKIQQTQI